MPSFGKKYNPIRNAKTAEFSNVITQIPTDGFHLGSKVSLKDG